MSAIVLDHLTAGYPKHSVLEDVTVTINGSTLTCLLGANGTGKSTLLRTICGFQPPLAGRLLIGGSEVANLSAADMARLVSIVLTERPDVAGITVSELVGMGRSPYTGFWGTLSAADSEVVSQAMEAVGITALARRKLASLSDGERQKAMVAKALAQQTPVILLDEPTAFLDYPSKVAVMKMLHHLAVTRHKTILMTTHDLELAAQMADELIEINHGKIIKTTAAAVLTDIDNLLRG